MKTPATTEAPLSPAGGECKADPPLPPATTGSPLSPATAGERQGEGAISRPRPLLAALFLGAVLGILANLFAGQLPWLTAFVDRATHPLGQLFVRALLLSVIPLAVSSLALALADLDAKAIAGLGARILGYAIASSVVAALIGLALVTIVAPGRGAAPELRALVRAAGPVASDQPGNGAGWLGWAIAGLVLATVAAGRFIAAAPTRTLRLRAALQRLHDLSARATGGMMRAAPLGVGALLFSLTARLGGAGLRPLLAYAAVVVAGLLLHGGGVYSLALRFLGGTSPLAFFRGARVAMATAFSTASSAATLPTALAVAEGPLRLPPAVARLVLTAGSAMNQNGTSLYEGVTVLFLAQVFGVELSLLQQAGVMAISVLAGVGSAGVPGGGTAAIAVILGLFGIPPEGVVLIVGVDRLLDMCRTTVNVTGDLVLAVIVAVKPSPRFRPARGQG